MCWTRLLDEKIEQETYFKVFRIRENRLASLYTSDYPSFPIDKEIEYIGYIDEPYIGEWGYYKVPGLQVFTNVNDAMEYARDHLSRLGYLGEVREVEISGDIYFGQILIGVVLMGVEACNVASAQKLKILDKEPIYRFDFRGSVESV